MMDNTKTRVDKYDKSVDSLHATVFSLVGELGAGKTTFVQRFTRACGVVAPVLSPTFNILKQYGNLVHIDAYRLKDGKDLLALGFQDLLSDPNNVILIEWGDRVMDVLPNDTITINFHHVSEDRRKITID